MLSSLILPNNVSFLDLIVTCDEKWIFTTVGDDQLSGWSKKKLQSTSQSQTLTKKMSQSLFGGLLPVWSTTAFWIPEKPLHLSSRLSKSMRCTKNCNTYSQYWPKDWAQFFSMTTPDCMWQNQGFKRWMNWATKFCLVCRIYLTSCQLTTTSSIWKTFCRENASITSRRQKILSKSLLNPEA